MQADIRALVATRASRDGVAAVAVGLALYAVFLSVDLYDAFHEVMVRYEEWEIDEIVTAVLVAGIIGFVYSWRRVGDLKAEIRRRNAAEDQAAWYAFHDPLTRLPNRHYAEVRLGGGAGGARAVSATSVYAVDLDGFKKVNDLVGHHGGDELLTVIAERLKDIFPHDSVVRMGGDEFLIVSGSVPEEGATCPAEKIVRSLSRPVMIGGMQVEVGASVGVARVPEHARDVAEAIRCADLAMYAAKRSNRHGICVYQSSMKEAFTQRVEMERALREAIRLDRIAPHYQPLIRLEDGAIHGFEALARWTTEDGRSIPPDVFIDVAEEAGLITDLSNRLLREACMAARSWPADLRLAFNISPTQLTDRLLGLRILRILGETGFPPHRLEIEVTESAIVRELESATEVIEELRKAGIHIVLDDFGKGYSSLSQLSNLSFDQIKIDRSFVSSFLQEEKQMKIVKAIVGLGTGLGISTTAEGIEQEGQRTTLQELGCDFGQGYLFGKAMPGEQVAEFLGQVEARKPGRSKMQ